MPKPRFGTPLSTVTADAGGVEVHYSNGTKALGWLNRLDLIRLAGAIAHSTRRKSGGVRWDNVALRAFIITNTPWQSALPGDKPLPDDTPKKGEEVPEDGDRKLTKVTCACGHDYQYRIKENRFDATKTWLEGKDCPPCQKTPGQKPGEGGTPGAPAPTPDKEYEQEVDDEEAKEDGLVKVKNELDLGDLDLDKLAEILAQKVHERMAPVALPPLHHAVMPEVIKTLAADIPVWLQGPPGTSKSTIGAQAAETLKLPLHAISCHEAMTRSDMFGYTDATGTDHRSPLWEAYEHGGVLLLDEIDNGNANILAAMNSALSNGFCTFAGKTYPKHPDFRVVATANTAGLGPESGFIGRMGVDLATLDRFVTIQVPIDEKLETAIVKAIMKGKGYADLLKKVRKIRKQVDAAGLRTVVSPRTSIFCAKQMLVGVSFEEALRRTAFKGMDETTINSLLEGAGLSGE